MASPKLKNLFFIPLLFSLWLISCQLFTPSSQSNNTVMLTGNGGSVDDLAISADGQWLAAVSREGQSLLVWSLDDLEQPPFSYFHEVEFEGISYVALHPAGTWVAVRAGAELQLLPLDSEGLGSPRFTYTMPQLPGRVDFSPDGTYLTAATRQGPGNPPPTGLFIWDMTNTSTSGPTTDQPRHILPHELSVHSLIFSPDGNWLATGHDQHINLWLQFTTATSPIILPEAHFDDTTGLALWPDGQRFISSARLQAKLHFWTVTDPLNATLEQTIETGGQIRSIALSPDSRWLASAGCDNERTYGGCRNGTLRVWDTTDLSAPPIIWTHPDAQGEYSNDVAYTPDGNWLAVALDNGQIWLHQTQDLHP